MHQGAFATDYQDEEYRLFGDKVSRHLRKKSVSSEEIGRLLIKARLLSES